MSFSDVEIANNSTVDGSAPTLQSVATSIDGTKVILTYDESLSSTTADKSTFSFTTDGSVNAVTDVGVVGATLELILTNPIKSDQSVEISYTSPSQSVPSGR